MTPANAPTQHNSSDDDDGFEAFVSPSPPAKPALGDDFGEFGSAVAPRGLAAFDELVSDELGERPTRAVGGTQGHALPSADLDALADALVREFESKLQAAASILE